MGTGGNRRASGRAPGRDRHSSDVAAVAPRLTTCVQSSRRRHRCASGCSAYKRHRQELRGMRPISHKARRPAIGGDVIAPEQGSGQLTLGGAALTTAHRISAVDRRTTHNARADRPSVGSPVLLVPSAGIYAPHWQTSHNVASSTAGWYGGPEQTRAHPRSRPSNRRASGTRGGRNTTRTRSLGSISASPMTLLF